MPHLVDTTCNDVWKAGEIADVLCECGSIALDEKYRSRWELKPDGSLVTAADVLCEKTLRETLTEMIPGSSFLGEETIDNQGEQYLQKALTGYTWVVDPIDGTAPYTHHIPFWAVSIGLMLDGVLKQGGIILPELGEMLITLKDDVAYTNEVNLKSTSEEVTYRLQRLEPPDPTWNPGGLIIMGQTFAKTKTLPLPNPVLAPGSAVASAAALMTGKAMFYIGSMKLWDLAGFIPMMQRLDMEGRFVDNAEVFSPDIKTGGINLQPDTAPKRWYLRKHLQFGRPAILDEAQKRLNIPREP